MTVDPIARQTQQGGSNNPAALNRQHGRPPFGMHGAYQPFTPQQTYVFAGRQTDGQGYTFRVLAGFGGPKVTQGWPKVNVVDRPLRLGFTIPAGYDPFAVDIPVQFEALTDRSTGRAAVSADLEYDIQKLEWMAGRGRLYAAKNGRTAAGPAAGSPPIVSVASLDAHGNQTDLIPRNLHKLDWVVTNIQYDNTIPLTSGQMPASGGMIRDRDGHRVRQAATVSLLQYIAAPGATNSAAARQQARGNAGGYKTFYATRALDTIYKIVMFVSAGSAQYTDVVKTLDFNRDRLKVRSYSQHLKPGTAVRIPTSVLILR